MKAGVNCGDLIMIKANTNCSDLTKLIKIVVISQKLIRIVVISQKLIGIVVISQKLTNCIDLIKANTNCSKREEQWRSHGSNYDDLMKYIMICDYLITGSKNFYCIN